MITMSMSHYLKDYCICSQALHTGNCSTVFFPASLSLSVSRHGLVQMKVWAESYVKIPIKFLPRETFNIQGLYKNVCDMIFAKDEAENDYFGKKEAENTEDCSHSTSKSCQFRESCFI